MIAKVVIAIASLASLAAAQSSGVGIGNQTIVPTSVDVNTRNGWCVSEKNTCTTLCSQNWSTNDCDTTTLKATCVCADNSKPSLVEYRDTLPFFVCQEYIAQCVAGNATEPDLQAICRNTNTCGNTDPADFVPSTTIKTSSAPTTTGSGGNSTNGPATTTGAQTNSPSSTPNAAAALEAGSAGLMRMVALVAALGFAGFGLAL
ncbi:hypothetical protein ABW20_dc0105271 [Dactylellina cionopaga]|nr:hypothetical protein ABW20_dc0105271 [Dactylellina cionopaga]